MGVFGTWLQAQLASRGWDQRVAGAKIGVAETTIHNWIHQDIKPSVKSVLRIAKVLRVPVEQVLEVAGYDNGNGGTATPDDLAQQRAQVLAALPQFAEIIDLLAQKPPERQAAYLEIIRRLLIDPRNPDSESSQ